MFVITGATGNIGSVIARNLLEAGESVRAIGRSKERLQPLIDKGAEPCVGSLDDPDFLVDAFDGAKMVFAMVPPNFAAENVRIYQNKVIDAMMEGIIQNIVEHVVGLSSIGAHIPDGTGPIAGVFDMEKKFGTVNGLNALYLRPAFFMENLLMQVNAVKNFGFMASAQDGNISVPVIATKDIAEYATKRMLAGDFKGKTTQELLGERHLTMNEVASVFGKAIGMKDLKFVQVPYADAENALMEMGASRSLAEGYTELVRGINDGSLTHLEARSTANTTLTSIEEFSKTFAALFAS